ncbi:unnamed protein product [Closterium sp. NIES-64]|nr:unnamed protein product [Closterium sp. NIES-64]
MNNLWTQTWDVSRSFAPPPRPGAAGGPGASAVAPAGPDFTAFNAEVSAIEEEIKKANNDVSDVRNAHNLTLQEARAEKLEELRKDAARSSAQAKNRTKKIKKMLEELKLNNEANRMRPGSGPGTAEDRHRTNITVGLAERLRGLHRLVLVVEEEIQNESRKKLQRHLFMVTGKPATDEMLDEIIEHGQSEDVLKRAVQMQGRDAQINEDQLRDAVVDIDEKMDVVLEVTKGMVELQNMFMDMAIMVEEQGAYLNRIDDDVNAAKSHIVTAAKDLEKAEKIQSNTRHTYWLIVSIVLIIAAIIVASVASLIVSAAPESSRGAVIGVVVVAEIALIAGAVLICVMTKPLQTLFTFKFIAFANARIAIREVPQPLL